MQVFIGQHSPATRATTCKGCGASYFEVPTGYGLCEACDLFQMYSDVYKSYEGFRPSRQPMAVMRAYLARVSEPGYEPLGWALD